MSKHNSELTSAQVQAIFLAFSNWVHMIVYCNIFQPLRFFWRIFCNILGYYHDDKQIFTKSKHICPYRTYIISYIIYSTYRVFRT